MVSGNELTNNMADWVTAAEASRIWKVHESQVGHRMRQGRLAVWLANVGLKSPKRYFFKRDIVEWQELKKGNPDFIDHVNGEEFSPETKKVYLAVMEQLSAKHPDVVLLPKATKTKAEVEVRVLDGGLWKKTGIRKL